MIIIVDSNTISTQVIATENIVKSMNGGQTYMNWEEMVNIKYQEHHPCVLKLHKSPKDGITRERIVALFTFVGDVAVHQIRMKGEELIHLLMKWSFRYLVEHICRWVQEAGGWVSVTYKANHHIINPST